MKRHEGGLSAYIAKWKEPVCKATHCMIPTLWHSEKGRTTEAVKTCMLPGVRGREGEKQVEHRIFLGRWNCSVWCCDSGRVYLHIYQNPENVRHRVSLDVNWRLHLTIMYQRRLTDGTNAPCWSKTLTTWGTRARPERGGWTLPCATAPFFCEPKTT